MPNIPPSCFAAITVSIRTRPEGRVMHHTDAEYIETKTFQSAPGPRAG